MLAGLEDLGEGEFLGLVSHLMLTTKGVEIHPTEAKIEMDSEEFQREYRAELKRMLNHFHRPRGESCR